MDKLERCRTLNTSWVAALVILSLAPLASPSAASAVEPAPTWTCSREGRLVGQATETCSGTVKETGWHFIDLELAALDSTGDAVIEVQEMHGRRGYLHLVCRATVGTWGTCSGETDLRAVSSRGDEPGIYHFELEHPALVTFFVRPRYCQELTCTDLRTIPTGHIIASIAPGSGPY